MHLFTSSRTTSFSCPIALYRLNFNRLKSRPLFYFISEQCHDWLIKTHPYQALASNISVISSFILYRLVDAPCNFNGKPLRTNIENFTKRGASLKGCRAEARYFLVLGLRTFFKEATDWDIQLHTVCVSGPTGVARFTAYDKIHNISVEFQQR